MFNSYLVVFRGALVFGELVVLERDELSRTRNWVAAVNIFVFFCTFGFVRARSAGLEF